MKTLVVILLLSFIGFNSYSQSAPSIIINCFPTAACNQPLLIILMKSRTYILNQSSTKLINPNVIEKFDVLQGAAATAIYGRRAMYGVIIIRIKKTDSRREYKRLKQYLEKL